MNLADRAMHGEPRLGSPRKEVNMNRNVSAWERVLRVLAGVTLLALAVVGPKTVWGLLGVVPLITGAMGFCPLYRAFGVTSFRAGHRELHVH